MVVRRLVDGLDRERHFAASRYIGDRDRVWTRRIVLAVGAVLAVPVPGRQTAGTGVGSDARDVGVQRPVWIVRDGLVGAARREAAGFNLQVRSTRQVADVGVDLAALHQRVQPHLQRAGCLPGGVSGDSHGLGLGRGKMPYSDDRDPSRQDHTYERGHE